ncbi:MAG: hypothetical protein ABFD86_12845, partial [Bryobacteraceae bacterium]
MFPFFTNPDGEQTINWFTEPTYGPTGLIYKTQYPNHDETYRYWAQNLPPLVTSQFLDNGNAFVASETKVLANASGTPVKASTKNFIRDKNGELLTLRETDVWSTSPPSAPVAPTTSGFTRITSHTYSAPIADYTNSLPWNTPQAYWYTQAPRHDLLQTTTVTAGGTTRAYSESAYDTDGNLTESRQWDDRLGGLTTPLSSANAVIRSRQFESHNADYGGGHLLREYDGNGNRTEYSYQPYVYGSSHPYPTQIVRAYGTGVAATTTYEYDQHTGWLASQTDADNNVTTSYTYDLWGRRTGVNEAEVRSSSTSYDDLRRIVWTTSPLDANRSLVAGTTYDWLGRAIRTGATNDAGQHPA